MRARTLLIPSLAILFAVAGCPREATPGDPAPAPWTELFTDQDWNDIPEGQGEVFTGVVRYAPADGLPSFVMRYNPYKLEDAGGGTTDIYCGSSGELEPFIGNAVDIEGRIETVEVEGSVFVEIWPARIRPARGAVE